VPGRPELTFCQVNFIWNWSGSFYRSYVLSPNQRRQSTESQSAEGSKLLVDFVAIAMKRCCCISSTCLSNAVCPGARLLARHDSLYAGEVLVYTTLTFSSPPFPILSLLTTPGNIVHRVKTATTERSQAYIHFFHIHALAYKMMRNYMRGNNILLPRDAL